MDGRKKSVGVLINEEGGSVTTDNFHDAAESVFEKTLSADEKQTINQTDEAFKKAEQAVQLEADKDDQVVYKQAANASLFGQDELSQNSSPDAQEQEVDRAPVTVYGSEMMDLCQVKAGDFQLLGYEEVTAQTVWDCVKNRVKGEVALHQIVDEILSLQIGTLMNYLTISAYKGEFLDEEV